MAYERPKGFNPPGRPKGGTSLHSPALRAIRAQAIIEARAMGTPVRELAYRYKTSEQSIYRLIQWAKKEGLMGELHERAVEKLGSLSLDVYENAMRSDTKALTPNEIEAHKMKLGAAKDVAFGIGILQKKVEKHEVKEEFSLQWYLENKRSQEGGEQAGSQAEIAGIEPSIDSAFDAEILAEGSVEGDDLLGLPEPLDGGGCGESGDGSVEPEPGDGE